MEVYVCARARACVLVCVCVCVSPFLALFRKPLSTAIVLDCKRCH